MTSWFTPQKNAIKMKDKLSMLKYHRIINEFWLKENPLTWIVQSFSRTLDSVWKIWICPYVSWENLIFSLVSVSFLRSTAVSFMSKMGPISSHFQKKGGPLKLGYFELSFRAGSHYHTKNYPFFLCKFQVFLQSRRLARRLELWNFEKSLSIQSYNTEKFEEDG